jgi:hypothetical protein
MLPCNRKLFCPVLYITENMEDGPQPRFRFVHDVETGEGHNSMEPE